MNNTSSVDSFVADFIAIKSPPWVHVFAGVIMTYLLVLGVSFNGLVLFVFFRNRRMINRHNILPLSIILNGFCMACFSFILPTIAEFSHGFLKPFTHEVCVMEGFSVYVFGLASLLLNTAIATYRYFVVLRPAGNLQIRKTFMLKVVIMCEVIALLFALCPLLGWGSYGLEAHGTSCGLAWHDQSTGNLSYIITIGIVCYFLPLTVIIYSYARIVKIVRHSSRALRSDTTQGRRGLTGKEMRLIKFSVILVCVFVLSWTPYAIVSFYVVLGNPRSLDPVLSRSAAFFAKAEVIWNPIVCVLMMNDLKKALQHLLLCKHSSEREVPEGMSRITTIPMTEINEAKSRSTHANFIVVKSVSNINDRNSSEAPLK